MTSRARVATVYLQSSLSWPFKENLAPGVDRFRDSSDKDVLKAFKSIGPKPEIVAQPTPGLAQEPGESKDSSSGERLPEA